MEFIYSIYKNQYIGSIGFCETYLGIISFVPCLKIHLEPSRNFMSFISFNIVQVEQLRRMLKREKSFI